MYDVVTSVPPLPARAAEGHKGTFGKVLVAAGSYGMSGAAVLVGRSILRSGAGLARVAVPRSILPIVAAGEPCYTTIGLLEDAHGRMNAAALPAILEAAKQNQALAVGPGMGVSPGCRKIVETLIGREGLRLVLDADGLNNLAGVSGWQEKAKARVIMTPHPGEMGRLWKSVFRKEPPRQREQWAAELAEAAGCTIVLKGRGTVVSDGRRVYVNATGNPGMATGGTGDVLTGVIASLAAQGLEDFDAAALGVYVHGRAGDLAAERVGQDGMIATDVIDALPAAFRELRKEGSPE